ncbi:MAG: ribosome maturation factor RimP [Propionibacteriaceae bacterium]|jgi:ribosome maturation factor RimP|nr:ribosome maturation factor RimP [Propionibacteriaceae bacterium]
MDALQALATSVAAECGLEVDRVEVRSAGRRKLVQIFLDGDGPDGRGPSLDDISAATRALSRALDEADLFKSAYTLEVSSRGVNRPLTQPKHFRRNIGRLVEIAAAGGAFTGRIEAADSDGVVVDGKHVAFSDIAKAVVQVEMRDD